MLTSRRYEGGLVVPARAAAGSRGAAALSAAAAGESPAGDTGGYLSDGGASAGSSANEYAEGLGCADRKRCRERSTSGFEFDDHPREEYFEEPQSHRAAVESSDDEFAAAPNIKRRAIDVVAGRPLRSVLAELEHQDNNLPPDGRGDRSAVVKRQLATVARRCERRRNTQQCRRQVAFTPLLPLARQHIDAKAQAEDFHHSKQRIEPPSDHPIECQPEDYITTRSFELAELRRSCTALTTARVREEAMRAAAIVNADSLKACARVAMEALARLEGIQVDAQSLKSTGVGLELNRAAWRQHADPCIAARSAALVAKWRGAIRVARALGGCA